MAEVEKKEASPSSSTLNAQDHVEKQQSGYATDADVMPRERLNAMFENPLGGISKQQLFADVDEYAFARLADLQSSIDRRTDFAISSACPSIMSPFARELWWLRILTTLRLSMSSVMRIGDISSVNTRINGPSREPFTILYDCNGSDPVLDDQSNDTDRTER